MTVEGDESWTTRFHGHEIAGAVHQGHPVVVKTMSLAGTGWRFELWARRVLCEAGVDVAVPLLEVRRAPEAVSLVMPRVSCGLASLDEASDAVVARLGRDLGSMHARCAADRFQRRSTSWARRVMRDLSGLADLPGAPDLPLGTVARVMDQARGTAPQTLVHRDLRADNLLAQDGRCRVIDWEVATIGHPDLDLARLRLSLREEQVPVFDDGYARTYHETREFDRRRWSPGHRALFRLVFCAELWRHVRDQATRDAALVPFLAEVARDAGDALPDGGGS